MILPKLSHWNIKSRVVSVDSIIVTLEATAIPEPAITLGTRDHWNSGGNLRLSDGICRSLWVKVDTPRAHRCQNGQRQQRRFRVEYHSTIHPAIR